MQPRSTLLMISTLFLILHMTDTEAINRNIEDAVADFNPKSEEESYTVYEQVSDLMEMLASFDRNEICEKFNVSELDPFNRGEEWNVKFGKVLHLLKFIVCTEGQDAISGK